MHQFYVHAAKCLPEADLHDEDKEVDGVYLIEAAQDENDPLTLTAVLNEFHDCVAIKVLEDFEIGVKNAARQWVYESDNEDDPDPDDLPAVSFCGLVEEAALRESAEPPPRSPRPSL